MTENKDGTVDPYRTDATAPPTDGKVLDPEKLTHEFYRQFGAVVRASSSAPACGARSTMASSLFSVTPPSH